MGCAIHGFSVRTQLPVWIATAVAALLSIPVTYAVARGYEVLFLSEPNPATVVWSPHIALFWRLAIASYVAGLVAPMAYLAARRDIVKTSRVLGTTLLVVGVLAGIQGLLVP
jgi:hypothetical protein